MARTADEIMNHHMEAMGVKDGVKGSSQGQDIPNIMSDYSDDLIAIVNMGGQTLVIHGREELEAMVSQITAAEPDPEFDNNFEVIYRQSAGDHVVIAFKAGKSVPLAVFSYTVKDGKATHVSGFQWHPDVPIVPSCRVLTEQEKEALAVVQHHIDATLTRDVEYILQDFADDVVIINSMAPEPCIGKAALTEVCKVMYQGDPNPENPNAHTVDFRIKEAAGNMVLLEFEADMGIGTETYIIENGKVVFTSAVFQPK